MFRNYWNFGSIKNKHFPSTDKIQKGMRNILANVHHFLFSSLQIQVINKFTYIIQQYFSN